MVSGSNLHHPMVNLLIIHETGLVIIVFYNLLGYSLTDSLGSCLFSPSRGRMEYILDLNPTKSNILLFGHSSLNYPGSISLVMSKLGRSEEKFEISNHSGSLMVAYTSFAYRML